MTEDRIAAGRPRPRVAVIGGGFCGLAAAWELGRLGIRATVLEADSGIGGLAGSFAVGGTRLEKFYHHWFTGDADMMRLIAELGLSDRVETRAARTGTYFARDFFALSTPLDLLRFSPLPLVDRLRLGLLTLRVRRVRDWRALEDRTAADWLRELGGERVWRVVWEPLLRGKFGDLAEEVAAVWFWNKIKLRGGSRGKRGEERLAYFRGGFAALVDALAEAIRAQGGEVRTGFPVARPIVEAGRAAGVAGPGGTVRADAVIATPAPSVVADLVAACAPAGYAAALRRIRYLANICVVLELDRPLSDFYWLNVNDPGFPFVGAIEHTNFEPASTYGGRRLVYLSRYLSADDPAWSLPDGETVDFAFAHLRRMFPDLERGSVLAAHVWRARWAQPVVERGHRASIPEARTPLDGLWLANMAQIYPEDRGTNYAVAKGREVARLCAASLGVRSPDAAPG